MRRAAAALLGLLCLAGALDPAGRLADPAAEARARSLFRETRCLVCQGESIDDSDALLAGDLRRLIRDEIARGQSDGQIRAALRARYGDFVLLRPPFDTQGAVLWAAPFVIALVGAGVLARRMRAPRGAPPLSPDEEERLATLAKD